MTIVVGGSITTPTPANPTLAKVFYASNPNPNTKVDASLQIQQMEVAVLRQGPGNRNTVGDFPIAATTPTTLGLAGAPIVGATLGPRNIGSVRNAGSQINKLF